MNPIFQTEQGAPPTFVSLFERRFELAVIGAGLAGFAAVRSLVKRGFTVLWLEPSGDLLWEVSRALETRLATTQNSPQWREWLTELEELEALSHNCFDGAMAEIIVAREATLKRTAISPLFHAVPVKAEMQDGCVASLIVATRAGFKRVQANRWIDASETGVLARLASSGLQGRAPSRYVHRLALQSADWQGVEAVVLEVLRAFPGAELERSARESERLVSFPHDEYEPWYQRSLRFARQLRSKEGAASVLVSHHGLKPLPIYDANEGEALEVRNLVLASPAWSPLPVQTAGDRFALGVEASQRIHSLDAYAGLDCKENLVLPPVAREVVADVVVAGSGTAGATAALASSREGARTVALEQASFPGGIGSGGGISIYFHGASGGLQDEVDRLANAISALYGASHEMNSWHHDAKKAALWSLMEEAGVDFRGGELLCGVEKGPGGRLLSVLTASEEGLIRYRAKAFIDSTGDGDLAALAGVPYHSGRPGDARTLAYSQVSLYLAREKESYKIGLINFDAGWVDATDPEDYSRARLEGLALHCFPSWPVADRPFLLSPLLGVRQSRHFTTREQVTLAHLIEPKSVRHPIGRVKAIVDTHSVDFEFESNEMLYYLWVCQGFHDILEASLPYEMLLPPEIDNLWIACRAAGIESDASYCVRMQRDIQRLGEAAGVAAATSAATGEVDFNHLRERLVQTGALTLEPVSASVATDSAVWLKALDSGESGVHLWHLAKDKAGHDVVALRLKSSEPAVSFHAAAILAFGGDARALPRLLEAIERMEEGHAEPQERSTGAFGQWIDVPRWLKAIALLRSGGDEKCIPFVIPFVGSKYPLNVRTLAALTLEALARRSGESVYPALDEALTLLETPDASDGARLPPSRSLWAVLQGGGIDSASSWGLDLRQDHRWQLSLAAARIAVIIRRDPPESALVCRHDYRGYVRKAFADDAISRQ